VLTLTAHHFDEGMRRIYRMISLDMTWWKNHRTCSDSVVVAEMYGL